MSLASIVPLLMASFVAASILSASDAAAATCLKDDSVVAGVMRKKWEELGGKQGQLGCPLSVETNVPDEDGRYIQFLHGQIVWSPTQQLLLAAVEDTTPERHLANITLRWWVLGDAPSYDFFLIRWSVEGQEVPDEPDEAGGIGGHNEEDGEWDGQKEIRRGGRDGSYRFENVDGRFRIRVEGCHDGGFLARSKCPQSWSNPAVIDAAYIDLSGLPTPRSVAEAHSSMYDRRQLGILRLCGIALGEALNEDSGFIALAKLDAVKTDIATRCALLTPEEVKAATDQAKPPTDQSDAAKKQFEAAKQRLLAEAADKKLIATVDAWLKDRKVSSHVGTGIDEDMLGQGSLIGLGEGALVGLLAATPLGVGVLAGVAGGAVIGAVAGKEICSRAGEYDFALTNLIPLMYDHGSRLTGETYLHVLNELLDQVGGADQVTKFVVRCGLAFPETENHITMTESARYLTNQLRLEQARAHGETSPAFLEAQKKYDNELNGMNEWMLKYLQDFLKNDFHEYNSRPYARLTIKALQNLAAYAGPKPQNKAVAQAATMVLDYLSARFAVSTSKLRRAAPFRRRAENKHRTELYGRHSDADTWRFLTLIGNSDPMLRERFGHAPWIASSIMAFPRLQPFSKSPRYEVPGPIADLMINDSNRTFWQGIRHEGVEVYAGNSEFLISGGGRWEGPEARDSLFSIEDFSGLSPSDVHGQALPTTLIPAAEGVDRSQLIRIDGHSDGEERVNTCVAPGFACGLNPVVPRVLLHRFPRSHRPCAFPVIGRILEEWRNRGAEVGPLGCPVEKEHDSPGVSGRVQEFERGQIVWSAPQKIVMSARYSPNEEKIVVEWRVVDEFSYDFFIVRWDWDGKNVGQHDVHDDDPGASATGGRWSIPMDRYGAYAIRVEGCKNRFLASSRCSQSWSGPVTLDFPSKRSCTRGQGNWTFASFAGECNTSGLGSGYLVAVYSNLCPEGESCEGQRFGFFDARVVRCAGPGGGFDTVKPGGTPTKVKSGVLTQKVRVLSAPSPCLTLDAFMADVLKRNGSTTFSPGGENDYRMPQDRVIRFIPDHSRDETGIVAIDGKKPELPARIDAWGTDAAQGHTRGRLGATGSVISADGLGCVVIRNAALKQSLILNMRDWKQPKRKLDLTTGDLTCKAVRDVR